MTEEEFEKSLDRLRLYADWEGTEVGETCNVLIETYDRVRGYVSDEYEAALKKEILAQLKMFDEEYKLIKTETEIVVKPQVYYGLEWKEHYTQEEWDALESVPIEEM